MWITVARIAITASRPKTVMVCCSDVHESTDLPSGPVCACACANISPIAPVDANTDARNPHRAIGEMTVNARTSYVPHLPLPPALPPNKYTAHRNVCTIRTRSTQCFLLKRSV